jgi:RNase adaptor protein for sRNA GlmZ degradation
MDKDNDMIDDDDIKSEISKSKNKLMKLDSETEMYVDTTDMSSEEIKMFRRGKFDFVDGEIVETSGKNKKRR